MPLDRQDFCSKLAQAIDPNGGLIVTGDTIFKGTRGWDSIASVSIVAMVFVEYDVQVTGDEIVAAQTVDDLAAQVESKLAGAGTP